MTTLVYSLFTILGISSFLHPIMTKCEVTTVAITNEDSKNKKIADAEERDPVQAQLEN